MRDKIETLLKLLPHKLQVEFTLYCVNDVRDLITDQASLDAIALTEAWLKDSASVSQEELRNAANAAYSAHLASAANASRAAYAAYAAYAAAYAATNAAYAAANAAYAARTAYAAKDKDKKLEEYYKYLISMIKDMPKVELEIYRINIKDLKL